MFQYSIHLNWSDQDNGYIALIPEFPGLSAFGGTPEKATKEARIAAESFAEIYQEDGRELPEPIKIQEFSGQLRLRLPKSLHKELSINAEREGVSLNSYLVALLSERNAQAKTMREIKNLFKNSQPQFIIVERPISVNDWADQRSTVTIKTMGNQFTFEPKLGSMQ